MKSIKYLPYILINLTIILSLNIQAKNLGHRAGGGPKEYWKNVPENSLKALEYSLIGNNNKEATQNSNQFLYLEFDVQETYDGKLVVFHDEFVKRMLPNKGSNKIAYKKIMKSIIFKKRVPIWRRRKSLLRVRDFTYKELKTLILKGSDDQYVPLLSEYLNASVKYKLIKPMAVEVKSIKSKKAKFKLIELVGNFQKNYMSKTDIIFAPKYDMPFKAGFLAFPHALMRTFGILKGTRKKWCDKIIEKGLFGIFKPGRHNNQCS